MKYLNHLIGKRIGPYHLEGKATEDFGFFFGVPQYEGYRIVFRGYDDSLDIIVNKDNVIVAILDKSLKRRVYDQYIKRKLTNHHHTNVIKFKK